MTSDAVALWNSEAPAYDEAPDHGLLDAGVRATCRDLLLGVLPPSPAARRRPRLRHRHPGRAARRARLRRRRRSTSRRPWCALAVEQAGCRLDAVRSLVTVRDDDAADPGLAPASVDVVLCPHVLCALPDPVAVRAPLGRERCGRTAGWCSARASGRPAPGSQRHGVPRPCATPAARVELRHLPAPALRRREITDERDLSSARP